MRSPTYHGLHLPTHKQQTRDAAIVGAPVPDTLVLPLNQHGDAELRPCVQVGDAVRMGQLIAQPALTSEQPALGACLHSPVSGSVLAIEPHATARPCGDAMSIIIGNDHLERRDDSLQTYDNWADLQPLSLCALLARGGMAGLGGAVFPTATKLAAHVQHPLEYLLINGMECEPYITCDDRLMRERAEQILQGAQILLHAAQARHCRVAIESDKPEALAAMRTAAQSLNDSRIEIHAMATAYPSGDEGQLIAQLLHREIPRGALPADVGVIVQNVATAYACARWIHHGEPLISRIVTVTGPGIHRPGNMEVRLGTRMSDLITTCGGDQHALNTGMLIMGGAMMGRALAHDHYPIIKASNCLIVAAHALKPAAAEMPCIRCGECAQACPVHLLPQQLLTYARNDNRHALHELGLSDCIECGYCDYVCPSNITLAARFYAAKQYAPD
ncbi:MAG: electron transport complex subunit RsxC [Steroidobacteraceae bacterium]